MLEEKFGEFEAPAVDGATSHYLDELRNHYLNEQLEALLTGAVKEHGKVPGKQLVEKLQARVSSLARETNIVRDLDITDYDAAKDYLEKKKQRAKEMGGSPGIPTGLKVFDAFYPTGLAGSQLIVVLGWSGHGKTWFASLLACRAWEAGFRPMIVSLEMSPEEMRERIYTLMGSGLFSATDFNRGSVDIGKFDDWATKSLSDKQRFIVVSNEGAGKVTPLTVQGKIDQYKPDIVICDYHQLFDDSDNSGNEVVRNRNISRDFKKLAVSNNIPIIDLSQATQDTPDDTLEPPRIEQVAWSKGIQHDADLAIAVHKYDDTNIFAIVARKSRHGQLFEFALNWDIDRGVIEEKVG